MHQFLVVLSETNPLIWRRIQVPERYSFWDLHVAIQDAMGWLDYHLHEFRLLDAAERNVVSIGIPTDDDPQDRPVAPGWQVPLSKFFDQRSTGMPNSFRSSPIPTMRNTRRLFGGQEASSTRRRSIGRP